MTRQLLGSCLLTLALLVPAAAHATDPVDEDTTEEEPLHLHGLGALGGARLGLIGFDVAGAAVLGPRLGELQGSPGLMRASRASLFSHIAIAGLHATAAVPVLIAAWNPTQSSLEAMAVLTWATELSIAGLGLGSGIALLVTRKGVLTPGSAAWRATGWSAGVNIGMGMVSIGYGLVVPMVAVALSFSAVIADVTTKALEGMLRPKKPTEPGDPGVEIRLIPSPNGLHLIGRF